MNSHSMSDPAIAPDALVTTAIARLTDIHAATICPMTPAFRMDEQALADHVAAVAGHDGIEGLLINGHAGENFLLTRE